MWKEEGEKNNLKTKSKRDKKKQTRRKSKTEIIYAIERRREREREGKQLTGGKNLLSLPHSSILTPLHTKPSS